METCSIKRNKICKGKDIEISFPVTLDGQAGDLSDKDLLVELTDSMGYKIYPSFETVGNTIKFSFYGIEHKHTGTHSIRLWLNKGKIGQCMLDYTHAFELVSTTEDEYFIESEETSDSEE